MKSALLSLALTAVAPAPAKTLVPRLDTDLLANAGDPENVAFKKFLTEKPEDPTALKGKRFAVITTDGVEEIELTGPVNYLKDRGAVVDLVAPRFVPLAAKFGVVYPEKRATHILTVRFFEIANWYKIDRFVDEVAPADYDAFIVPGGAWNPDGLRADQNVLKLLQGAHAERKIIAAICHGPLVLVNAGLLQGKNATSYWNVHTDLKNAGANVLDQAVVTDGNLVTSRFPYDLPQFMDAISTNVLGR